MTKRWPIEDYDKHFHDPCYQDDMGIVDCNCGYWQAVGKRHNRAIAALKEIVKYNDNEVLGTHIPTQCAWCIARCALRMEE